MKPRTIYGLIATGGVISAVSAFWQTLELLTHLEDKATQLTCNLNSVFSCSTVFDSWQSSAFGFPNSIMCLILFTIFASVALVGLANGKVTKGLRLAIQYLALFTLGFGLWFLWESTYSINALCVFCVSCFLGLLLINWGFFRLNADDLPIHKCLKAGIKNGADTFVWLLFGLIIAFVIFLHF
ncbi:MAG TPA: vitamin K epoxide reductase family protein [Patescibacteria group bacterium]|nr:vitamin K epoxide reductase family protein [Patescibacteria group bacterium]